MTIASPFQPARGQGAKVTTSTSSATVTMGFGCKSLRAINLGATAIYFRTGKAADGTVTATNADTPIGPSTSAGSVIVIEKPQDHDTVAYIADSATPVAHFQPGEGGA